MLVASCTSRFTSAIACAGIVEERGPLGSGRLSLNAGIAKEPSHATLNNQLAALGNLILCTCENVLTVTIFVDVIIRCKKYFMFFYFRGSHKPQKYFYNKNFQIYGIQILAGKMLPITTLAITYMGKS